MIQRQQAGHQGTLMRFQPVPDLQEPAEILVRVTPLRPFNTDKSVAAVGLTCQFFQKKRCIT